MAKREQLTKKKKIPLNEQLGEFTETFGIGKPNIPPPIDPFSSTDPLADVIAQGKPKVDTKTDTSGGAGEPPTRDPAYPGEVVVPEYFTPSAKRSEGIREPAPEQIRGVNIQEERRRQFGEESGATELSAGLQEQILNPPSLKPASIFSGEFGAGGGINTPIEKTLAGLAIGGVALGAAAFFGAPVLAAAFTGGKIAGVLGLKVLTIGKISALIVGAIGAGKVSSIIQNKGRISELRSEISRAAAISSTTLSAVAYGADPIEAINSLRLSVNAINEAESAIKQLAIYNINFRLTKEYETLQLEIRNKRQEINERIFAIQNVAAGGRSAGDPENLMYTLMELERIQDE